MEESFEFINSRTKALAAYIFTNNRKLKEEFVRAVSAGGLVINDTTLHVSNLLLLFILCISTSVFDKYMPKYVGF